MTSSMKTDKVTLIFLNLKSVRPLRGYKHTTYLTQNQVATKLMPNHNGITSLYLEVLSKLFKHCWKWDMLEEYPKISLGYHIGADTQSL